ncbi:hypothetical protein B7P43_G05143 [Cryptotermes secundus]|uniref:Uncharacterized protein n=1 Tax=Cryptotermes secundus TaxID=105785 RepID=A0A2J7PEY9_9NEOP|nr:uncharacterized protein LOC111874408 [Cryptotermes secundus]PNF14891.1 hypothetical protein B7P43_G05143 [Cryptotermes secundus]
MKVVATILSLVAAASAAAVLPVESSVVKSDRVGDSFSYSIHQNQGYAVGGVPSLYPYEFRGDKVKQVVPATAYMAPVELKSTEYKHVVPVAPFEEYKHVVPVSPIQLKSTVLPAATYVSAEPLKNIELKSYAPSAYVGPLKSFVHPAATLLTTSPVRNVGYIQPSPAYVSPAVAYSHDTAVPITYGSNIYAYPYIKPEKMF